ncbi:hypothetical protein [uncultured Paraglaciecola sp.]|uniref:hypothetical protein n=1 Tax=uncultured Paraglaciecola sp. TaxID=1765024 RepID=UPI0026220E9E|nr:hypothetical protein [uncultured Paraglaciecola sp.]
MAMTSVIHFLIPLVFKAIMLSILRLLRKPSFSRKAEIYYNLSLLLTFMFLGVAVPISLVLLYSNDFMGYVLLIGSVDELLLSKKLELIFYLNVSIIIIFAKFFIGNEDSSIAFESNAASQFVISTILVLSFFIIILGKDFHFIEKLALALYLSHSFFFIRTYLKEWGVLN